MPSYQQVKDIQAILELIFGKHVPPWIIGTVNWAFLLGIVLFALWAFLQLLSKIKDIWTQNFWPLFYNEDEKRSSFHRRLFAGHIESEIIRIGRQEDWKDYRFTDLEAEVEIEGKKQNWSWLPFVQRTSSGLQREKSLSKALTSSRERLILVQGEPGSGKSVALRHVAEYMASIAKKSKRTDLVIPLYVNLKNLEREDDTPINRNLIEAFVLSSIKRIHDRDIDDFLDNEFHKGLKQGTWLFLFDSFDELPDVLSSTESDDIIKQYGNAIDDFLHGTNRCRGIVASRQYNGPAYLGWPQFIILALTNKRQLQLIQKANLKKEVASIFLTQLETSTNEIQLMAKNPLSLNLLCEHVKQGYPFPKNAHTIFETYIENRLTRDKERIYQRFQIDYQEVKSSAEIIAFCMTNDRSLGLSASRSHLKESLARSDPNFATKLDSIFDALEYMKLAREEASSTSSNDKNFTFAHRRFQEYFTTCYLIKNPELVSPHLLFTDARWREIAVTLFQTQPVQLLDPLINYSNTFLKDACNVIKDIYVDIEVLRRNNEQKNEIYKDFIFDKFTCFSNSLHVLRIIQEGFANHFDDLPEKTRSYIGEIVMATTNLASLPDRMLAIEVSGPAPETIKTSIIARAFTSNSELLRTAAYQQVALLKETSPIIEKGITDTLIYLLGSRQLRVGKKTIQAHLMRLKQPRYFLSMIDHLLSLSQLNFYIRLLLLSINFLLLSIIQHNNYEEYYFILLLYVSFTLFCLFGSFIDNDIVYDFNSINLWQNYVAIGLSIPPILSYSLIDINDLLIKSIFIIFCILIFYYLLVFPCYIFLLRRGQIVNRISIPFTPIYNLFCLFGDLYFSIKNVHVVRKNIKISKKAFLYSLIAVILLAIFYGVVVLGNIVCGILLIIFTIIFIIVFSFLWIKNKWNDSRKKFKDFQKWRKWFIQHNRLLTHQEFGEATLYYSSLKMFDAIRKIRYEYKMAPTEEVEKLLKKIALKMEQTQKSSISEKRVVYIITDELNDEDIEGLMSCRHLWIHKSPALLDEIYSILEEIIRTRQKLEQQTQ